MIITDAVALAAYSAALHTQEIYKAITVRTVRADARLVIFAAVVAAAQSEFL